MRVIPSRGAAVEMGAIDPAGVFEAFLPRRKPPLAYRLEATWPDGTTFVYDDPYALPPSLGELDLYLIGEGRHEELYDAPRRPRARARGLRTAPRSPSGHRPRARSPGRRLQRLGRPRPPASLARRERRLGALHPGPRLGQPLQVRDPARRRAAPAEGRSGRSRRRGTSRERVRRLPGAARVGRRRLARAARHRRSVRRADLDLRGAPGLVAAQHARGQPAAHLPRARRRARRVRDRPRLHPCRAAAGDGAPVLGLVGLPGDRLLRPHLALRLAGRLQGVRRQAAPGRDRRDPRLGAGALPA